MDGKNILAGDFDIIDDETVETKSTDKTYVEDNSLASVSDILLGDVDNTNNVSVEQAMNMFNANGPEAKATPVVEIKEEPVIAPVATVAPVAKEAVPAVEAPGLSDELDNTLMIAKQAINPETISSPALKKKPKSKKFCVILIVVLVVILAGIIISAPSIIQLLN